MYNTEYINLYSFHSHSCEIILTPSTYIKNIIFPTNVSHAIQTRYQGIKEILLTLRERHFVSLSILQMSRREWRCDVRPILRNISKVPEGHSYTEKSCTNPNTSPKTHTHNTHWTVLKCWYAAIYS
jgi:hypothetical protein